MLKKLLLLATLVSSSFAFSDHFWFQFNENNNENPTINLIADFHEKLDPNPQDWIGIYKKGATNDWDNVQQWTWVKPKMQGQDTFVEIKLNLADGDYEARYFLNNSYTTFRTKAFTLKAIHQASITVLDISNKDAVYVDSSSSGDNKDWIGIYKKGASNSWNNVLGWTWVYWANGEYGGLPPVINLNLSNGEYEARLFYHNSYNLEAKASFTINDNEQPVESIFSNKTEYSTLAGVASIEIKDTPNDHLDTDWVGLFKHGAQHTLSNLIAWSYIKGTGYRFETLTYYKKDLLVFGENSIDAVYFHNNSYTDVKDTKVINLTHESQTLLSLAVNDNKTDAFISGFYNIENKDWIAIFKKGDSYIANNIISWTYGQNLTGHEQNAGSHAYTWKDGVKDLVSGREYTAVFFKNDTYTQVGLNNFTMK